MNSIMRMPPANGNIICGYDLDANRVVIPPHVLEMSGEERAQWFRENHIVPAVGGAAFSQFEMMQPFMVTDGVAVTAAADTVLTQDTILTLPANFFSFPGQMIWFHAAGKVSNVVTTQITYTFRLRYNALAGTILAASGAMVTSTTAATDNLWYLDCYIKALATGQLATSLTLLTYGRAAMANDAFTAASYQAGFMPAGGVSLANVTGLDGTIARAITLSVVPSLATGSITCRDAWIVSLN